MQKNMWLACKYLRLSIDDGDKEESESIVNQAILIDSYFKSTEDMAIIETFKDDGYTGTDFNRPGFQAMMKEIEKKSINCIIVKDLSRFGRDHIEVDRYIQKVFPQMGVRFIAINDNYDSLTANMTDTHLVVPVKTLVNETYSRENSKKIRSHLEAKRSVLKLADKYSAERLEAACRKALSYTASTSYKSIKNILAAGQEKIEPELQTPDSASTQNKHAITRGADYYRR
ncbi:MAG: recombinase family protein [Ruminococcus sp.]|jgi:site-specific DNA recombinase